MAKKLELPKTDDFSFETLLDDEDKYEAQAEPEDVTIAEKPDDFDLSHPWVFDGKPILDPPDEFEAFVYMITNTQTKKRYIGFKKFYSSKIKVIKHRKHKIKVQSNWATYWSSSDSLAIEIEKYGKGAYIREIVALCPNSAIGKFVELEEQLKRKVLTDNADLYYNGIVNVRINQNHLRRYNEVKWHKKILQGDKLCKK